LYIRLKRSITYGNNNDKNEINDFLKELPHTLKIELSLHIYEDRYKQINFFKG